MIDMLSKTIIETIDESDTTTCKRLIEPYKTYGQIDFDISLQDL